MSKEREIIRYHKHRVNRPSLNLDDPSQLSRYSTASPFNIKNTLNSSSIKITKTPNSYQRRLNSDQNQEMMMSTINLNDTTQCVIKVKKPAKDVVYDKNTSGDYGLILSSKYQELESVSHQPSHHSFNVDNDNGSPLKRWKKHLQNDDSGRIQLMSNVFNS